jgi:hypothetical protein
MEGGGGGALWPKRLVFVYSTEKIKILGMDDKLITSEISSTKIKGEKS